MRNILCDICVIFKFLGSTNFKVGQTESVQEQDHYENPSIKKKWSQADKDDVCN